MVNQSSSNYSIRLSTRISEKEYKTLKRLSLDGNLSSGLRLLLREYAEVQEPIFVSNLLNHTYSILLQFKDFLDQVQLTDLDQPKKTELEHRISELVELLLLYRLK